MGRRLGWDGTGSAVRGSWMGLVGRWEGIGWFGEGGVRGLDGSGRGGRVLDGTDWAAERSWMCRVGRR